jgi:hypothetical protein
VGSPDSSSDRDRTYPWTLGRGAPLASLLAELAASRDVGPAPDPMLHHGIHQGSAA